MGAYKLTYHHYSERSILVTWPNEIDKHILYDILNFKMMIKNSDIKQIIEVNNAYNSILVSYEFTIENIYDEILRLKTLYADDKKGHIYPRKLWHIPVCYDAEFGSDLEAISAHLKLEISQIITLHSSQIYTVFFIGFLPGFMYLGGLAKQLHMPRKAAPKSVVPKGGVAIGGQQTGIYPTESPGGWHIIGNTPINFFDPHEKSPCFVQAGDQIKFHEVSLESYQQIIRDSSCGVIHLKSEEIYG